MAAPFNETDVVRKTYFINEGERSVDPADDEGKVVQLEEDGRFSNEFLKDVGNSVNINVTENTYAVPSSHDEADLFSTDIPANTLGTDAGVRFELYFSSLAIPPTTFTTITFRLKYGATTIATLTTTGVNSAISQKGVLRGYVLADGSASAQKGVLEIRAYTMQLEQNGDAAVSIPKILGFANGTAAEDSTVSKALKITGDFSAAGGSRTLTSEFFVVEKISTRLNL